MPVHGVASRMKILAFCFLLLPLQSAYTLTPRYLSNQVNEAPSSPESLQIITVIIINNNNSNAIIKYGVWKSFLEVPELSFKTDLPKSQLGGTPGP